MFLFLLRRHKTKSVKRQNTVHFVVGDWVLDRVPEQKSLIHAAKLALVVKADLIIGLPAVNITPTSGG